LQALIIPPRAHANDSGLALLLEAIQVAVNVHMLLEKYDPIQEVRDNRGILKDLIP